jgi:hypothetical protein
MEGEKEDKKERKTEIKRKGRKNKISMKTSKTKGNEEGKNT